jgi:hypothetical protein
MIGWCCSLTDPPSFEEWDSPCLVGKTGMVGGFETKSLWLPQLLIDGTRGPGWDAAKTSEAIVP